MKYDVQIILRFLLDPFCWPSNTKQQPVPPSNDQVQPSTNQHRLILTQNLKVPTSSALYQPNNNKVQTIILF